MYMTNIHYCTDLYNHLLEKCNNKTIYLNYLHGISIIYMVKYLHYSHFWAERLFIWLIIQIS